LPVHATWAVAAAAHVRGDGQGCDGQNPARDGAAAGGENNTGTQWRATTRRAFACAKQPEIFVPVEEARKIFGAASLPMRAVAALRKSLGDE
jgi:hypothetical protein